MDLLLGIDIGTYESKGVIVEAASGRIVAQAAQEHGVIMPRPGWAEHDAESIWWSDFIALCRQLLSHPGVSAESIRAIGVSAIAPTMLAIDRTGRPLRPAILYGIDTRTVEEIEDLTYALGHEWLLEHAGSALSTQSAGPKILWFRRHEPELYRQTWKILTASSYLVFRLTGRIVIDHYTAVAFAPLYDLPALRWSETGAALICDLDMLPDLHWTTEVVGEVTATAARETGLRPGTPVIAGTADAAAEAIAAGATRPGDCMIMYGTTVFLIEICDRLLRSGVLWPTVFLVPGTYALTAGMATAGAIIRWFRDQLAPLELRTEMEGGPPAYEALIHLAAESPPGSRGLVVLPYFSGERTPIHDPHARGLILGLTISHRRSDIYRALLEGIAYGIRHNIEVMIEMGAEPSRLIAIGGGTKNPVWLQIVSDVLGRPQEVRGSLGAAYGDAFLAGMGIGYFQSLTDLLNWLGPAFQVEPILAHVQYYDLYYTIYKELYPRLRDLMHRLADLGALVGGGP